MKPPPPSCSRQGLTLIELLVAIAITVLLVSVVYMVYGTALNTIRAQSTWRESLEPAADALDVLQRDLLCALVLKGATNPSFVLAAAEDNPATARLHFFTAEPGAGSNDWRAYGIREVEYSLRTETVTGRLALIRQCRPFRIPAVGALLAAPDAGGSAAVTNPSAEILLHSLAGMQIQVYDGNEWTNAWGAGAGAGALPKAARITLQIELPSGPRKFAMETLIPAGHQIKAPAQTPEKAR